MMMNALIGDRAVAPDGHPDEPPLRRLNPYHCPACPAAAFRHACAAERPTDDVNGDDGSITSSHVAINTFVSCSPAQVQSAIDAANVPEALSAWVNAGVRVRYDILKKAAAAIDAERHVIAAIDAVETGIPLPVQRQIVEGLAPVAIISMDRALSDVLESTNAVPGRFGHDIVCKRRPMTPALIIAPWNVPCGTIVPKLFVALLCGAHVIVKPSEFASTSIARMVHVMHRVIFGEHKFANVLQLVLGAAKVGAALVASPIVQCVQFTGAPRTAAAVATQCAPQLKPLLAECGGSNSLIVCADACLTAAVRYAVMGLITLNGQWCMGVSRVIIHKSVKEEFLARMRVYLARRVRLMTSETDVVGRSIGEVAAAAASASAGGHTGDASDGSNTMGDAEQTITADRAVLLELGPLASQSHADFIRESVAALAATSKEPEPVFELFSCAEAWGSAAPPDSVAGCACAALPSSFVSPCAIIEPDPAAAARRELFAPCFSLNTFETCEEAVRLSNLSTGQLVCFIFSKDVEKARGIGFQIRTGMAMINSANFAFEPQDPSMDVAVDFWGSAGLGVDGTGAAAAAFFSKRTWCGVNGDDVHDGHV